MLLNMTYSFSHCVTKAYYIVAWGLFFRLSDNLQSTIGNYLASLNIKSHETVSNSEVYGKTLASSKGNSHQYL